MPRRQYEAVTVGPFGITRVVLEKARPQDVSHGRGPHWQPRMARIGLLDGVNSQHPNGVYGFAIKIIHVSLPSESVASAASPASMASTVDSESVVFSDYIKTIVAMLPDYA